MEQNNPNAEAEDLSLTPRQFQALEAAFDGQNPRHVRSGTYADGRPYYRGQTNMGGAVGRMIDDLTERGFLPQSLYDYFKGLGFDFTSSQARINRIPEPLRKGDGLTAKGLRALEAALARKKYDPTDDRLNRVRDAIPVRVQFEKDLADAIKGLDDTERAAFARKQAAQRLARIADLRELLPFMHDASDDDLLAFAKQIEATQFSKGYLRFLDESDLYAELDELGRQSHKPGTLGASMRSEKVQAIRAELNRRAEAA